MADSNDIGVKMSQPGYDVKSAGDANLYFTSSWPILKIQDTQYASSGEIIKHDLKYPPLALVWNPTDGLQICSVNSATITMPALSQKSRYFLFRLPLNQPYQSRSVKTPIQPSGGIDHNFGLKFAKPGKDINSDDLRDYTLHSSARSPLLHAVLAGQLKPDQGGYVIRWQPDLPYTPLYFAFYSTDNETFIPLSTLAQTPPKVIISVPGTGNYGDGSIYISSTTADYGSLVILKDPLTSDVVTRVNL